MAMPKLAPVQPAHDKLRALGILALNGMFDEMDALGVLRYAVSDVLPGDLAIVSSFGADSAVLLHLVAQVDPSMPVYFLETGKHFVETLAYVETLKKTLGLTPAATSARPSRSSRSPSSMVAGSPAASATRPRSAACCRISS